MFFFFEPIGPGGTPIAVPLALEGDALGIQETGLCSPSETQRWKLNPGFGKGKECWQFYDARERTLSC
jgi:hypothetical protein